MRSLRVLILMVLVSFSAFAQKSNTKDETTIINQVEIL
jgi:hypothetical protein